jgi:hypothetical protein
MIEGGLLLVAVGAVLRFAVGAEVPGVNLPTVALILLIVGGAAVLIGLAPRISGRDSAAAPH